MIRYADLVGRHPLFPSPEQVRERERILAGRFFLVRTAGIGDRLICGRCNASHPYLSWMCVEQPFSGLTYGIHAYWNAAGGAVNDPSLPATERMRLRQIRHLVGAETPDLASAHPSVARRLDVGERDLMAGAFTFTADPDNPGDLALGILEPIDATTARILAARIRSRDPSYRIAGLKEGQE